MISDPPRQQAGTAAVCATHAQSAFKRACGAFMTTDLTGIIGTVGTRAWNVNLGTDGFPRPENALQASKSTELGQIPIRFMSSRPRIQQHRWLEFCPESWNPDDCQQIAKAGLRC